MLLSFARGQITCYCPRKMLLPWGQIMLFLHMHIRCYFNKICDNTRKCETLHTLSLGCNFITLKEPYNNQRPKFDIAWLHVTNHLYNGFPS